jgi:hypothetical protein
MKFKCTNTENNRTANESGYANVMKPHTKEQSGCAPSGTRTPHLHQACRAFRMQKSNAAMKECNGCWGRSYEISLPSLASHRPAGFMTATT